MLLVVIILAVVIAYVVARGIPVDNHSVDDMPGHQMY